MQHCGACEPLSTPTSSNPIRGTWSGAVSAPTRPCCHATSRIVGLCQTAPKKPSAQEAPPPGQTSPLRVGASAMPTPTKHGGDREAIEVPPTMPTHGSRLPGRSPPRPRHVRPTPVAKLDPADPARALRAAPQGPRVALSRRHMDLRHGATRLPASSGLRSPLQPSISETSRQATPEACSNRSHRRTE